MSDRIKECINFIENETNSRVIIYYTSNRQALSTQIANDIMPVFLEHLDKIGDSDKITLILYTLGGDTLAAWSLVNLIRNFCKEFAVITPELCRSAGTLICLGANKIIMTKQATLGPIDPSVNGPLNPRSNGNVQVPVSVEQVNAYLELATKELTITDDNAKANILIELSKQINPLVLGNTYRTKNQIKMLASKLLRNHNIGNGNTDKIINFLCSESGSHDYAIHRKEAKDELGLFIEKPSPELYCNIKELHELIVDELQLREPFDYNKFVQSNSDGLYDIKRGIIQTSGRKDVFLTTVKIKTDILPDGSSVKHNNATDKGWKNEI